MINSRLRRHCFALLSSVVFAQAVLFSLRAWGQYSDPTPKFRPIKVARSFPPITSFQIEPSRDVIDSVNPEETVLGVVIQGKARAYPINMLTGPRREIINDNLAGVPIAATW